MILLENETEFNIDIKTLETIYNYLNINRDVELIITDNKTIQKLNKEYRGVDRATDVLSFPLEDAPFMPLGTLVISIEKAQELAKKLKHSTDDEIALLFIHGLLHLLGYDHEIDNGEMREKEKELIEHFNLPESLIVRVEEK